MPHKAPVGDQTEGCMKKKTRHNEPSPPWEETPDDLSPNGRPSAAEETSTAPADKSRNRRGGAEPDIPSRTSRKARWRPSLLGHGWIMKNIGFFLFLAALAVVYIYNGHYADKISRDLNRTTKELKELQYEYKTLKSEVMFRSKQSELAKAVEPFGLKELMRPPVVLVDSIKRDPIK